MRATTTTQALLSKSYRNAEDVVQTGDFRFPTVPWSEQGMDFGEKEPVWGEGTCPVCFTQRSCNGSCSC